MNTEKKENIVKNILITMFGIRGTTLIEGSLH